MRQTWLIRTLLHPLKDGRHENHNQRKQHNQHKQCLGGRWPGTSNAWVGAQAMPGWALARHKQCLGGRWPSIKQLYAI